MIIGNVRIGFATNSSSSHSIVIVKDPAKVTPVPHSGSYGSYGWENFVLKDKPSKLDYLANLLYSSFSEVLGERIATLLINDFFRANPHRTLAGIDHQSSLSLPLTRDSKDLERDFYKDFIKFLSKEEVIILGGNDNSDFTPKGQLDTEYKEVNIPDLGDSVWVKKQNDGWWTLFSSKTGAKSTFNFDSDAKALKKARTPDLIDLKITNYCETGCAYCYQDSNKKGKHANFEVITKLLCTFADMEVLEIALGGGETTKHPKFAEILEYAKKCFIVPNFSTRSFDWMSDPRILTAVKMYAGKIGFSCSTADDVQALIYHAGASGIDESMFTVHYVLGSSPMEELTKMMGVISSTQFSLLLLGYKETGRGCDFTPHDNSKWWEVLPKYWLSVGIDTCVAKKYKKELKALKINNIMYYDEEGKFSMYVDAVDEKVARSSFEKNDKDYTPISVDGGHYGFYVRDTPEDQLMKAFDEY
jgi:hypothetical protein